MDVMSLNIIWVVLKEIKFLFCFGFFNNIIKKYNNIQSNHSLSLLLSHPLKILILKNRFYGKKNI